MQEKEHYIQDALELYAVAVLQRLAEDSGVAKTTDARRKLRDFEQYKAERGLSAKDFESGVGAVYKGTLDTHLPCFFARLVKAWPNVHMDFVDVEKAFRNANKKGDFLIVRPTTELSVSLKNYRGKGMRPQVSAGTYNSFALGFLFDADGVGCYKDPRTGDRFKGSTTLVRDRILDENGHTRVKKLMQKMDELNRDIKQRFAYSDEFECLDEGAFNQARKECGNAGADLTLRILELLDKGRIKARLMKMTGLDGEEELLLLYQDRFADTITVPAFRELRSLTQAPGTNLKYYRRGQSIRFDFMSRDKAILSVDVPFTINKNGAWISGPRYEGKRYHQKEGQDLAWGQRRPKKSKELATSINTYIDFSKKEIFIEGCA